jgi:hypothetical protein
VGIAIVRKIGAVYGIYVHAERVSVFAAIAAAALQLEGLLGLLVFSKPTQVLNGISNIRAIVLTALLINLQGASYSNMARPLIG